MPGQADIRAIVSHFVYSTFKQAIAAMPKKDLTAGVIGGLGPAATIDFMTRVLALTPATTDQDHVHLLVDQNPAVPDRQDAILEHGGDPGRELAAMAARLEIAGSDFIVMPCNAAHAFKSDIEDAISIPFISIIDTTIDAVPAGVDTVGILETPACQTAGLYSRALEERGKKCIKLNEESCDELLALVYAVKGGDCGKPVRTSMQAIAAGLVVRGAEAIILGCTEIPLVLTEYEVEVPLIASTEALAIRTVQLARGERPLPISKIRKS